MRRRRDRPHRTPCFAYNGHDRVIHERARLRVLTSLVARPRGLLIADLKQLCDLTDGNLNLHVQVLQAAKVTDIATGFEHNRRRSVCRRPKAENATLVTLQCLNR